MASNNFKCNYLTPVRFKGLSAANNNLERVEARQVMNVSDGGDDDTSAASI